MIKIFFVLCGILMLSGCASTATWPWGKIPAHDPKVGGKPLCTSTINNCTFDDAMNNAQYAAAFCRDTFNHYERTLNKKGYISSGTGLIGVAAGVTASGVTGTASSVLSSISASTNAAQTYTDGLVSQTATSATMESIRKNTDAKMTEIKTAILKNQYTEASLLALTMANQCAFAPSETNQKILRSLLE